MRRRRGRLHRGFLAHDFTHADGQPLNLTACDVRGLAGETDEGYCRCTARPLPTRAVTGRGATSWWPYIARTRHHHAVTIDTTADGASNMLNFITDGAGSGGSPADPLNLLKAADKKKTKKYVDGTGCPPRELHLHPARLRRTGRDAQ